MLEQQSKKKKSEIMKRVEGRGRKLLLHTLAVTLIHSTNSRTGGQKIVHLVRETG